MSDHVFQNYREQMIKEFHEAFDAAIQEEPTIELVNLRRKLIEEEATELILALDNIAACLEQGIEIKKEDWIETLDGMADLQVVLSGTCVALKPLFNFHKAFLRVHESNMSKLGADGKPILRDDGKVLKGPNYKPPVLEDLV